MEEFNTLISNSLNKYFQVLARTGYKSYGDVYGLVVLCMINHILNNYSEYITEEDIQAIDRVVYCVGGTCLVDYPVHLSEDSIFHENRNKKNFRMVQDCKKLRLTEDNIIRGIDKGL